MKIHAFTPAQADKRPLVLALLIGTALFGCCVSTTVAAADRCEVPAAVFQSQPFYVFAERLNIDGACTFSVAVATISDVKPMPDQTKSLTLTEPGLASAPGQYPLTCLFVCDGRPDVNISSTLAVYALPNNSALPSGTDVLVKEIPKGLVYQDSATGADTLPTPANMPQPAAMFGPVAGLRPAANETMRAADGGTVYDWTWTQHDYTRIPTGGAPLLLGAMAAGMTRFVAFALYAAQDTAPFGLVPVCGADGRGGGRCPERIQLSPARLAQGWNQVIITLSAATAADPLWFRLPFNTSGLLLATADPRPAPPSPPTTPPPSPVPAFATCMGPSSVFVGEPFTVFAARDNTGTECAVTVGDEDLVTRTIAPEAPNATIAVPAVTSGFGRLNISCRVVCLDGEYLMIYLPLFVAPVPKALPDGVAPLSTVSTALVYQDPATGADFLPTPTNVTEALSIFFPRPGLFPVVNETMRVMDRGVTYDWRWTQQGAIAANSMTNIAGGTSTAPAPLQFGALPAGMTRFASFAVYVADWDVPVGFVPVCGTSGGGRCPSVFQVSPPSLDHGWNQVTFTFSTEAAADPLTIRVTKQSAGSALLQSVALPPAVAPTTTAAPTQPPSDDHSYGRYVGIGVGAAVGVALAIAVVAVVVVRRQRRVTTAEKAILYSAQEV